MNKSIHPRQQVFEITQTDIANAIARGSEFYLIPNEIITEAISRARPDATHIRVDLAFIYWNDPTERKRYTFITPTKARDFLVTFNKEHLQPFTLRLRAPVHIAEMRTRKGR